MARGDPAQSEEGRLDPGLLEQAEHRVGIMLDAPLPAELHRRIASEAGVAVLNQPFAARKNVATAGGCLSSQYLAAWVIARLEGVEAARSAIQYVAPVGEKEVYVTRALANISPFL